MTCFLATKWKGSFPLSQRGADSGRAARLSNFQEVSLWKQSICGGCIPTTGIFNNKFIQGGYRLYERTHLWRTTRLNLSPSWITASTAECGGWCMSAVTTSTENVSPWTMGRKVLDNLSLEKQKSLCHKRQREKKKPYKKIWSFFIFIPNFIPNMLQLVRLGIKVG